MNNRIKQFAEQCYYETYGVNAELLATGFNEEKFAELIVQECAEVAHCNFHVDGVTLGRILKEHFGVKE